MDFVGMWHIFPHIDGVLAGFVRIVMAIFSSFGDDLGPNHVSFMCTLGPQHVPAAKPINDLYGRYRWDCISTVIWKQNEAARLGPFLHNK